MTQRKVEDHLREEYSCLSSDARRVLHQLQTDVAYLLLPLTLDLNHHERIQIEARIKECESAIDALRRREEAGRFDEDAAAMDTLTTLPDIVVFAGLVFSKQLLFLVHT